MNIATMRAFVEILRLVWGQNQCGAQLQELKNCIGEHDVQLSQINAAQENIPDEKAAQQNWNERIGFQTTKIP